MPRSSPRLFSRILTSRRLFGTVPHPDNKKSTNQSVAKLCSSNRPAAVATGGGPFPLLLGRGIFGCRVYAIEVVGGPNDRRADMLVAGHGLDNMD